MLLPGQTAGDARGKMKAIAKQQSEQSAGNAVEGLQVASAPPAVITPEPAPSHHSAHQTVHFADDAPNIVVDAAPDTPKRLSRKLSKTERKDLMVKHGFETAMCVQLIYAWCDCCSRFITDMCCRDPRLLTTGVCGLINLPMYFTLFFILQEEDMDAFRERCNSVV